MNRDTALTALALAGAAFFIVFGLWSFFAPQSFFDNVADFPPYNRHLFHDVGAFQIGIGAALLAGVIRRGDGLFAALAGAGIGSAFHFVSHLQDHNLGGSDAATAFLGVLALLLLIGAVIRWTGGERRFGVFR